MIQLIQWMVKLDIWFCYIQTVHIKSDQFLFSGNNIKSIIIFQILLAIWINESK